MSAESQSVKNFYRQHPDLILSKRLNSPFPLRSYAHMINWESIANKIDSGEKVLEIGCGEGVLSVMLAKKGVNVVATDISEPNILAAKKYAESEGVGSRIIFLIADAENLPFPDDSFPVVVADNVLEHIPHFERGLAEVRRVMQKKAIIALPTGCNPSAWCLLGGDVYWKLTKKTPVAIFIGFFRFIKNIFSEGVNEGYAGKSDIPHVWRYPWVMRKQLKQAGFNIVSFEAATFSLPYFNFFIPLIAFLDRFKKINFIYNFGFGSIAEVTKK